MAIITIDSDDAFNAKMSSAGDVVLVIFFTAVWAGPSRLMKPHVEKMSEQYPDITFLEIDTDACPTGRSFSSCAKWAARFSRESIRDRLRQQELRELAKNIGQQAPRLSDAIPVRPVSHLAKALKFTVFTGVSSFTVAIVAEILSRKNQENSLYTKVISKSHWTLTKGEKQVAFLVGLNVLVFLLWRVKKLTPLMQQYFTNSFASKSLCAPMILSTFSHHSFIHLALNMYVTTTFASVLIDKFLDVQQFWAFYFTAASISSLLSLTEKALTRSPVRALGASGAILAMLTYTCMMIPEGRVSIIFVPNFDFTAQNAVYGIIAFDLLGLLFRFRMFDHAAHLGGSLFGVFYALYGQHWIWTQYGEIIEQFMRKQ
ncbi:unnamed protein product [Caenorhabditis bovis]|uniref:rhomboid protease n=1 Tax=Caenorhabditis bovis TaxID=2654633 RepID=A0A8S1FBN3_9PELO|nr:unnamed protein product [Caenorhabditis bovis]